MKRGYLAATLAAVTVALAGCGDSTGSDDEVTAGSVAFTYTGVRSGSYAVNGAIETNATGFVKKSFAAGVRLSEGGQSLVGVVSYLPVTSTTGDEVILVFHSSAAGATLNFSEDCATAGCPIGIIAFNTNPDLEEDDSDPFFFTTGSIHVTSVSGGRISGTFSGTAEDFEGFRTITVVGGTFDVPLLRESTLPSASRSVPAARFQRLRR